MKVYYLSEAELLLFTKIISGSIPMDSLSTKLQSYATSFIQHVKYTEPPTKTSCHCGDCELEWRYYGWPICLIDPILISQSTAADGEIS